MTITIRLKTDNAAFADGDKDTEINRILADYFREARRLGVARLGDVSLRDYNGNTVGSVAVQTDDDEICPRCHEPFAEHELRCAE